MEPRKRGGPPAARKPAPRPKPTPVDQVPRVPVEPEEVDDDCASPLKPRQRRPRGEASPGVGGGSSRAREAEDVLPGGKTSTDGTPGVPKVVRRRKVSAVSIL